MRIAILDDVHVPMRARLELADLRPGALIEIEAIAAVPKE
jgi:enamine deaminase RidA (YjgF/YER057c/UK114 family)